MLEGSTAEFSVVEDVWLGAQLNVRALRIGAGAAGAVSRTELQILLSQCGFAYARVPSTAIERLSVLQDMGFRVVDTTLSFAAETRTVSAATATAARARFAVPTDEAAVVSIAGHAFKYSRFHLDPEVPEMLADDIKRRWAGNFFCGQRGDAMIIAESEGRIVGFLQVIGKGTVCIIDLIATAPDSGRRGVARSMIEFLASRGAGGEPPEKILVSTQAANIPSCRLYESSGFRLAESQFTLHLHRRAPSIVS